MTRTKVPSYAADYPKRATDIKHFSLPFYCINCQRKRDTTYLTPDFGPFCDDCLGEIRPLLKEDI